MDSYSSMKGFPLPLAKIIYLIGFTTIYHDGLYETFGLMYEKACALTANNEAVTLLYHWRTKWNLVPPFSVFFKILPYFCIQNSIGDKNSF